jgi:hypothetical protein
MSSFLDYSTAGQTPNNPLPIRSTRAPTTSDIISPDGAPYNVGRDWVNILTLTFYAYGGAGNWILLGSGGVGALISITGDSGGAEVPLAGNFNILGTANQVLVAGTANTETISLIGPYTPATYTAHGVLLGEGTSSIVATAVGTNGQVFLGSSAANPAFGTLTTSTGIGFTTGAHALALNITGGGFNVNAASAGVALVAQNSYTVTQAGQASFSLPATASPGDMFLVASGTGNTGGWIITQGASQEIWSGTSHTTNGATGTLAGAIHTSVLLMCTVANTDFIVLGNTTGYSFT